MGDLLNVRPAPTTPSSQDEGFSTKQTPEERAWLENLYDGNAADDPTLYAATKQRGQDLWLRTGLNTDGRKQLDQTFRTIQQETGLPEEEVNRILDGHINGLLGEARVTDDTEEAAAARRIEADTIETRSRLATLYDTDAEDLLERTQRFIRLHPKLAQVLQRRGLGSRPDIVLPLVEHVRNINYR
jgi:hypothetical protein